MIRIWMTGLIASVGLLAACGSGGDAGSGGMAGSGGTAAAGGMGGTAAEQVVYRVENVGLFAVPSDGSTPAQRISQPLIAGGAVLSNYAISRDGTRVVYRADAETDGVAELYAVNPDGTDFQKLNAPLPVGQVVNDFVVGR